MSSQHTTRRDFLRMTGLAAAFLAAGRFDPVRAQMIGPSRRSGAATMAEMEPFMPDAEVSITAAEKYVQILPGTQTRVWSYEGQLLSGSGVTVTNLPGVSLGPILRAKKGTKIRIYFHNDLAEPSVIHPHGLRVPEDCDGQPMQAIDPGQTKVYEFQVIDRACPAWFHPHPMGLTAHQVVMGMAGLFSVWDDEEASVVPGAATGANDLPVIIQDRSFDATNQIYYQPNQMWGYLANRILINGKLNASFSLEPRGYRLRFLNGSNARTYKLAWSNGMAFKVIGTDGGLLPAPVSKSYIMLMPGERVDVWADFSGQAGRSLILKSLSFDPGGMGGMGGGGGGMVADGMGGGCGGCGGGGGMGSGPANGTAFNLLTVNIGKKATSKPMLGTLPSYEMPFNSGNVSNYNNPVPFVLAMQRMMTWTINGLVYDPMAVADNEMVYLGVPIAWEWVNTSPIPHPMHIHNVQFQVLKRTVPNTSSYATINQGLLDTGWKDTVLVWPGERVRIAMKFEPYTGMYMYHCHILEHEDMTMMRNYMIMDPMMPPMDGM